MARIRKNIMNMKCVQVEQINKFTIKEVPVPKPEKDEILIKVLVTGLCRTDLKIIRVGHRDLVLPRIPGEEVVGLVHEVGPNVTDFQKGELVYVYPGKWCEKCPMCKNNSENLCKEMRIMGFHRDGGFAEYVSAPVQSIIKVPENLTPEQAVFAEPLSCCLNALEKARLKKGDEIAIWGAGPAGTLLSRASKALGANPVSFDPDERRSKLINGYTRRLDKDFDVCIVAVGERRAYEEALVRVKPGGCAVIFSGLPTLDNAFHLSFNEIHYNEYTVVGAYGCCYRHGQEALNFLKDGKIVVDDMISHKMSLYDLDEALDIVAERKGMKVLLYP